MPPRPRLRVLVTAGPTREYLDPVRYISNDSSGRMGFAVAHAARRRGWQVTLVHGPVGLRSPRGVRTVSVVSTADMLARCAQLWPKHDALIMAAAVADYTPARPARSKRKKSPVGLVLRLKPTVDILARLSKRRRKDQVVVGFALEDRSPRWNAQRKLVAKGLDAVVLSRPEAIGAASAAVEILVRNEGWRTLPRAPKERLATQIVRLVERLRAQRAL